MTLECGEPWMKPTEARTHNVTTVKRVELASSAEYLISGINRHKRGVALMMAVLVLALAGILTLGEIHL